MPPKSPALTSGAPARAMTDALLSRPSLGRWGIVPLPLAWFWFRLINNLQPDWKADPQYSYGLLVPFLCIGLLLRRWHSSVDTLRCDVPTRTAGDGTLKWPLLSLFIFPAILYLPTRLIEAAVPEWNPIQWLLGIETVTLTLCFIRLGMGRVWLRQLAFPICFFLVAIPWPALIEQPIIQTLTRVSAAVVVNLLGLLGLPALTHGNLIEVSTGMVGIDEACSGIRSFQSSLMISLFFGEFYRLSLGRRSLLVPLGFLFSVGFNVLRMSLLTWIAATKGINAISEFHDPAGITIAILCTLTLWGLAAFLKNPRSSSRAASNQFSKGGRAQQSPGKEAVTTGVRRGLSDGRSSISHFIQAPSPMLASLACILIVWVCASEAGVQLWYHVRESHLKPGPAWTLGFPLNNPTFQTLPIDDKTKYLLRFDNGKQGEWTAADGTQWQAFYFNWLPGRVAGYLAKRHTPEICLTAEGLKLLSGPKLDMMNVHGVQLPIRCYQFESNNGVLQVFHCRWDAGAQNDDYVAADSARFNLIRAIWTGRGDKGQKVLEFVISGQNDPAQAKQALAFELNKLIQVDP